jgi:hypothetical protein
MTIHWGREVPGWLIFTSIVLIFIAKTFFPPEVRPGGNFDSESVTGPEYESPLNDSMPYYQYRRIEDSLKAIRTQDNFFLQGNGTAFSFATLGIASYGNEKKKEQFFTVSGYSLENFASVENNLRASILNYPVWDNAAENSRNGHIETKPLNIKYQEGKEPWGGKVLVSIGPGLSTFLTVTLYILAAFFIAAFLVILYIPFRFFLKLSKGQAFNEENIGGLYLTAWSLISIALLASVISIIGHVSIQSQIPKEISFSYYAAFIKSANILLAGLGVLLLAKAFLQGLRLKEEQDLTI